MKINPQSLSEMASKLNGNRDPPELCMHHGSRNSESDIDILFIFKGGPVKKSVVYGQFDINQIEFNDFQFRLMNWDIEYTEPILTGDYVFGNRELLERSKSFLNTEKPTKGNLDYIGKRALETYLQAEMLYANGKDELFGQLANRDEGFKDLALKLFSEDNFSFNSSQISKSVSLLTYSLGYLASKERHRLNERNITLKDIRENPHTLYDKEFVKVREYLKNKKDKSGMKFTEIDPYFTNTKNLLMQEAMK